MQTSDSVPHRATFVSGWQRKDLVMADRGHVFRRAFSWLPAQFASQSDAPVGAPREFGSTEHLSIEAIAAFVDGELRMTEPLPPRDFVPGPNWIPERERDLRPRQHERPRRRATPGAAPRLPATGRPGI